MFKVGDKVRAVQSVMGLTKGKIYTISGRVVRINPGGVDDVYGLPFTLKEFPKDIHVGFYSFRFEPIEKRFNIEAATDQELADEYRRMNDERLQVYDALKSRGYQIESSRGIIILRFATKDVRIFKKKTTEL